MTPPPVTFTKTILVCEMDRFQLAFLCHAWQWLEANNLPYGGCDDSRYIFALGETGVPVAIAETRDTGNYLWLQLLLVRTALRRQGIGEALLREVIARGPAGKPIGLGTRPTNVAMKALAVKMGFTHEIHEHWRK